MTTLTQRNACILLLAISTGIYGFSGSHTNYGTQIAGTIEQKARTVVNDGEYYALCKVHIEADDVSGTGIIDAPTILIFAKKFVFTGTVRCSNKCIIFSEEPFDKAMFNKEGQGEFCIIIGKENKQAALQCDYQEHFSLEPIVRSVIDYPYCHPYITTLWATIAVSMVTFKIYTMIK